MKTKEKRRVFLQRFKCYKNTRHASGSRIQGAWNESDSADVIEGQREDGGWDMDV